MDRPSRATLVVIGGSAGALDALRALLPALPAGYPLAVALVVHLPRRSPSALVPVLATCTGLAVVEAEDRQPLLPGTLHVARPGYHLLVEPGPRLALAIDEPVHHSMPSIDVLFESAAHVCGPGVTGVVLSGANPDGAQGLAAVHGAGGGAAVQAPDDAAMPAMPLAALRACPAAVTLPARELGGFLLRLGSARIG